MINWSKRYDMTPTTAGIVILLWVFFIGFMLYPLVLFSPMRFSRLEVFHWFISNS